MTRSACASLLATCACVSVCAATPMEIIEEYTFQVTETSTPWTSTFDVPYYDGTRPLLEVVIKLEGDAKSSVDLKATTGDVVVKEGSVGAFLNASAPAANLNIDALPTGAFSPPVINVNQGDTVNLIDITGGADTMATLVGSPDVDDYVGAGTFEVELAALGTIGINTSGGNVEFSQRTEAAGWLTIQYKVEVPEPSSFYLGGMTLVGATFGRRRQLASRS